MYPECMYRSRPAWYQGGLTTGGVRLTRHVVDNGSRRGGRVAREDGSGLSLVGRQAGRVGCNDDRSVSDIGTVIWQPNGNILPSPFFVLVHFSSLAIECMIIRWEWNSCL